MSVSVLAVACGSGPTDPELAPDLPVTVLVAEGDTAAIGLGESTLLPAAGVSVTYVALVSDSRCPTGVTCVWEGDAAVRVEMESLGQRVTAELHTAFQPRSVALGDVVVELLEVRPYPAIDHLADPAVASMVVAVTVGPSSG